LGQTSRKELNDSFEAPSIPRFIVIDKIFTISTLFAPVPSSGKLEVCTGN
jgi:hypothetical protein